MSTTTDVWVTTEFVGFHRWPDAPTEVAYLRELHRHKFFVRVEISVTHNDREIEFHLFKAEVEQAIFSLKARMDLPTLSCEAIARYIFDSVQQRHPNRSYYSVSVSEDNENGATVTYMGE